MNPDDERLGELFRVLRRRQGLTQEQISIATTVPVRDIARLEAGLASELVYGRIRRDFAEVDGRVRINAWWKGAAADRLLDERHAELSERASVVMSRSQWIVPSEVTFSEFGERGSIDLFGHRFDRLAIAVCEVKSTFGSLEGTNRSLDAKARLAPKLCRDRFGWTPSFVGRFVIVPDMATARRVVATHRQTMDALYPARSREIRAWFKNPDRSLSGIWFLSDPHQTPTVPPQDG